MKTGAYIIEYIEDGNFFMLTDENLKSKKISKRHKKFLWLKSQEKNKILKVNDSGRWNSSKDYKGLYESISKKRELITVNNISKDSVVQKKSVAKEKKTLKEEFHNLTEEQIEPIQKELKEDKSFFGFHNFEFPIKIEYGRFILQTHTSLSFDIWLKKLMGSASFAVGDDDESYLATNILLDDDELYSKALDILWDVKTTTRPEYFLAEKLKITIGKAARIIDKLKDEGIVSEANKVGEYIFRIYKYFEKSAAVCYSEKKVSTSLLMRKLKLGYETASYLISKLVSINVIDGNHPSYSLLYSEIESVPNFNMDFKSDLWPIKEKISCNDCEEGFLNIVKEEKTEFLKPKAKTTLEKLKKGFLNIVKEEKTEFLNSGTKTTLEKLRFKPCKDGFAEKMHFPLTTDIGNETIMINAEFNFDKIANHLLNKLILKKEFTKKDIFLEINNFEFDKDGQVSKFLKNDESFTYPLSDFKEFKNDLEHLTVQGRDLTYLSIKNFFKNEEDFFKKIVLSWVPDDLELDINNFITQLYKLDIVVEGTQRRSVKDTDDYYKFSKKAKNFYKKN